MVDGLFFIDKLSTFNYQPYYPCLCLCLGFSQIIATLPFLLIFLHLSHIGFTDERTFIFYFLYLTIFIFWIAAPFGLAMTYS
jgi:hypothetical protein